MHVGHCCKYYFLVFLSNNRHFCLLCADPGSDFQKGPLLIHFDYKLPTGTLLTESKKESFTRRGPSWGSEHSVPDACYKPGQRHTSILQPPLWEEKQDEVIAKDVAIYAIGLHQAFIYLNITVICILAHEFKKISFGKNLPYWPKKKTLSSVFWVINTVNQRDSKYFCYCEGLLINPLIWYETWNGVERLDLAFISGNSACSERAESRQVSSSHSGWH